MCFTEAVVLDRLHENTVLDKSRKRFWGCNMIIYNLSVRVGKQIMRIKSDKQIIEMKIGEVISDLNPGRGRATLTDHRSRYHVV